MIKRIIDQLDLEREDVLEVGKYFVAWCCLFAIVFTLSVIGG